MPSLQIDVKADRGTTCSGIGQLHLEGKGKHFEVEINGPGTHALDLPPEASGPFEVVFKSNDCWTPSVVWESVTSPLELTAWPGQWLQVGVQDADEAVLREVLQITWARRQESMGFDLQGSATCSPEAMGWVCWLPVGILDIRLEPAQSAAVMRLTEAIESGEPASLEVRQLEPEAILCGEARLPLPYDVREVVLTLRPAGTASMSTELSPIQSFIAGPDEDGAFCWRGLPGGPWEILAELDDVGLSPIRPMRVELQPGRLTQLESPVVLSPSERVEIFLSPTLGPDGEPWTLRWSRRKAEASSFEILAQDSIGVEGYWIRDQVAHGDYAVEILAASGDQHLRQELEIDGPVPILELDMAFQRLTGLVSLGAEPLEGAAVRLSTLDGRRFNFTSEVGGGISGIVPRVDGWRASVSWDDLQVIQLGEVELLRHGDDEVFLELRLRDTRVAGVVLDLDGEAIHDALVRVQGSKSKTFVEAHSDRDGRFSLVGLEPGALIVEAEKRTLRSAPVEVKLREGEPEEGIELTLRERLTLEVLIQGAGGPLPGTRMSYRADHDGGSSSVTAGPLGRATIALSPITSGCHISVSPPGYPTSLHYVPIDPATQEQQLEIQVDPLGGELAISLNPPKDFDQEVGSRVMLDRYVHTESAAVALTMLMPGGSGFGNFDAASASLRFEVVPGRYWLCPTRWRTEECVEDQVVAGGRTVLNYFEAAPTVPP